VDNREKHEKKNARDFDLLVEGLPHTREKKNDYKIFFIPLGDFLNRTVTFLCLDFPEKGKCPYKFVK
jgi:hypothetical protein